MNKPVKWFSLSSHPDERVQQVQTKIFAQAGLFAILIAFGDLVVRGLILDRPLMEWIGSFVIVLGASLLFVFQTVLAGLYDPRLDYETKLAGKLKVLLFESIIMALGISVTTQITYGIPTNGMEWLKFFLKLIVIFAVFFGFKYLLIRISINRADKELNPKE